ncbi:MAG: DUF2505 domain-containing protein [Jatrophihabitans sp.]|uniref:DUF2505 domain-containing protein n=1 Tax=Jatrophihabitans sp. TaxID=1932789 RepID=UPI003F8149A1
MKVERTLRHERSAAEVFEMVCTPAFQEQKCRDAGALSWSVEVETDGAGAIVRTTRRMPTDDFPALLRKFVPSGVSSTETITWGGPSADGGRIAEVHVGIHGLPAKLVGTIELVPHDGGTRLTVDGDFTVGIPLVGRKVEAASVPIILRIIDAEVQTGETWAAGVH